MKARQRKPKTHVERRIIHTNHVTYTTSTSIFDENSVASVLWDDETNSSFVVRFYKAINVILNHKQRYMKITKKLAHIKNDTNAKMVSDKFDKFDIFWHNLTSTQKIKFLLIGKK